MGARRQQVRRIFIWQGLLIGIIGTVLGWSPATQWRFWRGTTTGFACRQRCTPWTMSVCAARHGRMLVAVVSLAISFIATVYPSQSAARVLPAEALRYE